MRRWTITLGLLCSLLVTAWGCSGPVPPSGRASADPEAGEESPRARRRAQRTVSPTDIPLLTLDGITLPASMRKPEGEAQAAEGQEPDAQGGKASKTEPPQLQRIEFAPPRNLFAFEEDPAVVAERQRKAAEAAKQAEEAAKVAAEARAKQAEETRLNPPPPQPPPIPFQFVGYFGHPNRRIGVFSVPGSPGVFLARSGETVMEKFKIVEIGYESAEIGFKDFKETQRIPLTGGGK
jgi:hypothetical protein